MALPRVVEEPPKSRYGGDLGGDDPLVVLWTPLDGKYLGPHLDG